MKEENVSIKGDFIRLDDLLKVAGAVVTGGHAKSVIQNGEVTVNGEICVQRGKKLKDGDRAVFEGTVYTVRGNGD